MCLLASLACAEDAPSWNTLPAAMGGENIRTVYADPLDKRQVYILTANGLLKMSTALGGVIRTPVHLWRGSAEDLFIKEDGKTMFLATQEGLQISSNAGRSWRTNTNDRVFSVLEDFRKIFLGTAQGLFVIRQDSETASRLPGDVGRASVRILRRSSQGILAVTNERVYLIKPGEDFSEMILQVSGSSESAEEGALVDASEEGQEDSGVLIRAVEILEGTIYVVSTEGIFKKSFEKGSWEEIPAEGVSLDQVSSLAFVKGAGHEPTMCVSSERGVQCQLGGSWVSVDKGLGDVSIASIKMMPTGDLWAAGAGLFVLPHADSKKLMAMADMADMSQCEFRDYASLSESFNDEPSVADVQKLVIRYSDTDKRKIDAWHRQSRIRAFVPRVSVGANRGATDFYHWDTGPNPDILQKGREYVDWDVSVSWDLAEAIWSSNQTSIDSRSKMMVELREQLLDQVTRLFFERRRLQIELASCQYPSMGERMAVEMRVDELTAHIDSYTGGEFSKRLNNHVNT